MKTCTRCEESKHKVHFGKWSRAKDGLRQYCKDCAKTYHSYRKHYYEDNKSLWIAQNNNRRDASKKATPEWLTQDQKEEMNNFYKHARDCFIVSGQQYHVDHIIPLRGKDICGLNVPWNLQILPADINLQKSNHC